jgi:hypothetical protein
VKTRKIYLSGPPRTFQVTTNTGYHDPNPKVPSGRTYQGYDFAVRTWLEGGRVGPKPAR